jgi:hypothetical protein
MGYLVDGLKSRVAIDPKSPPPPFGKHYVPNRNFKRFDLNHQRMATYGDLRPDNLIRI